MAVNVINTYFGRCRCCLSYGYLKSMWEEHYRDGSKEVFAEMLVECFALDWQQCEGSTKHDHMCETCIKKLRDAYSFKISVLDSQMKLLKQTEGIQTTIKIGQIVECKYSEMEDAHSQNTADDNQNSGEQYLDECYLEPDEHEEEYDNIEYLEDLEVDDSIEQHVKEARSVKLKYQENRIKFIKEIKNILKYTNATPFKCLSNVFLCAYCAVRGSTFENPNDLRSHTRLNHSNERVEKIDYVLRPFWTNEILRLDIHDLKCVVCAHSYPDWHDMLEHLKNKHNLDLNQALSKAIPYDLCDELKCALCNQDFTYYNNLDRHMNSHYNNYVCSDCGDTCLTEARYKRHLKIHDIDRNACSVCFKVFAVLQDKAKHEEEVHNLQPKFKCQYCGERFLSDYLRHVHLSEKHNEKVHVLTCEFCGKSFTWRPYYRKHMRKHKDTVNKFECEMCQKRFYLETELNDHRLKHIAKKDLTCYICNKKFAAFASLSRHLKRHKSLDLYR